MKSPHQLGLELLWSLFAAFGGAVLRASRERGTVGFVLRGSRKRGNSRRHEPLNDDKSSINEDFFVFSHSASLLSIMIMKSTVVSGLMPKFDVKTRNFLTTQNATFLGSLDSLPVSPRHISSTF